MEKQEKIETRGGARKGAGRKSMDPNLKKVQVSFYLAPEARAKLIAVAASKGIKPGELLSRFVDSL